MIYSAYLSFLMLFSLFTAQANETSIPVAPTVEGRTVIDYDEKSTFWTSLASPPDWPLTASPRRVKSAIPLATLTSRNTTDRDIPIGGGSKPFKTEGYWWEDLPAPFTIRNRTQHEQSLNVKNKKRRKRRRQGKKPYSRSELIFNATGSSSLEEKGLNAAYFVKEFNILDPSSIAAIQIEAKFNKGLIVYINGKEVVRSNINPGEEGHNHFAYPHKSPPYIQMNVGMNDRWENSWLGIDSNVLKRGKNTIAAVVKKEQRGGKPSMYFDLRLTTYSSFGWLKSPFLQHLRQDGLTVSWETTLPSIGSVYIEDPVAQQWYLAQVDNEPKLFHEIRVRGLEPGKSYRYYAQTSRDGTTLKSPISRFRTAPKDRSPFTFLLYGDSRALPDIHQKLAMMMREDGHRHGAEFVIHTGDIVNQGYRWKLWQNDFFKPSNPLLQTIPIYPTVGNHEVNQKLYYDYFDLPNNESWYHFSYGNADFFAVNTNIRLEPSTEQYKWFENALAMSDKKWKIVFFHHPPFSCSPQRKPGDKNVQKHLVPLMEKYNVNLVLLGHDHLYGRTKPINGVVYLTSGGGGSSLYDAVADDLSEVCVKAFHYVKLHVNDQRIKWVATDIDGNVIEEYTLTPNQP